VNLIERNIAGLDVIEIAGDPGGPYVILFHGFGASAQDLVPLSQVYEEHPRPTWIFPNGPIAVQISPDYTGRAWFPIDIKGLQQAIQISDFDQVIQTFPPKLSDCRKLGESLIETLSIPRSKILLGGFSQGAVLATDLTLFASQSIAALLIFSGTVVSEADIKRLAPLHTGTPFFQSHGFEDPLLPMKKAQDLERLLQEGGLIGKLLSFHGGHEIPQSVLVSLHFFLKEVIQK